jgi:hypothetical protein
MMAQFSGSVYIPLLIMGHIASFPLNVTMTTGMTGKGAGVIGLLRSGTFRFEWWDEW